CARVISDASSGLFPRFLFYGFGPLHRDLNAVFCQYRVGSLSASKRPDRISIGQMTLSVLICAHDPRMDYLARVLQGLKEQDLPCSEWELLLIDNASRVPLAGSCDLSWHSNARCILETEVGLTPARLRGIKESKGELLVFVDDDNVLAPDYLAESEAISERYVFLGAWGAG